MKKSELQKIIREEVENTLTKNRLVDKFKEWVGQDKTPTTMDIDYYVKKHNLTPTQKSILRKAFPSDEIHVRSTGPSPDVRFKNK